MKKKANENKSKAMKVKTNVKAGSTRRVGSNLGSQTGDHIGAYN